VSLLFLLFNTRTVIIIHCLVKKEGQDVKFFEKVVLPLIYAYFNAHKNYFLASSSIVQTGTVGFLLIMFAFTIGQIRV
jgi:hypothetical protein